MTADCRERFSFNSADDFDAKYNWRIVRELYPSLAAAECENPHDTEFAFSRLDESNRYPD